MDKVRELTVISGKGGTGKTSLVATFAALASAGGRRIVLADCDVDASDLHLIMKPKIRKTMHFTGLKLASISKKACTGCGKCARYCRFGAVIEPLKPSETYRIDPSRCEGCGVCGIVCPAGAVSLKDRYSGKAYLSVTRHGHMAHAELFPGEEASGKLVTMVRENARALAKKHTAELIIIDGPPGTGCPVIASIGGADLVLIVTEPTVSGIHDMERVLNVCSHFRVNATVCINKFDINIVKTRSIESYCRSGGIPVVGRIPYDRMMIDSIVNGVSLVEYASEKRGSSVFKSVAAVWENLKTLLDFPAHAQ